MYALYDSLNHKIFMIDDDCTWISWTPVDDYLSRLQDEPEMNLAAYIDFDACQDDILEMVTINFKSKSNESSLTEVLMNLYFVRIQEDSKLDFTDSCRVFNSEKDITYP